MNPKCIICKREFRISGKAETPIPRRQKHAKTCSRKCSKIFTGIRININSVYVSKLKRQKTKFKRIIKEVLKEEVVLVDKKYKGDSKIDKGTIVSPIWIVNKILAKLGDNHSPERSFVDTPEDKVSSEALYEPSGTKLKNKCICGNEKNIHSKRCDKCHRSHKFRKISQLRSLK